MLGRSLSEIDDMPMADYITWCRFERESPAVTGEMLDRLFARLCYVVAAGNGARGVTERSMRLFAPVERVPLEVFCERLRQAGFTEATDG